jgi:endonuclease/exonuclease/phosphatase family metal-dependent hydrolase
VSWNVHVGGGDIESLVTRLRAGAYSGGRPVANFVLLLQEAYRAGSDVPRLLHPLAAMPGFIRPDTGSRRREDILSVAAKLHLNVYYAPSMRNGAPLRSDEDRGNAILATMPLEDLRAIELPFERQRRVVVAARIAGRTPAGDPLNLTVASVHLDNLVGLRYAWVFSGPARQRQARGVVEALPAGLPAVVGGDFNTWFGFRDPAFLEMQSRFPESPTTDRRATFAGLLRLDHMFFGLPDGWSASLARLDNRFGSDHHPLLGWVQMDPAYSPPPATKARSADENH